MPVYQWTVPWMPAAQMLDKRDNGASACLLWAAEAVDVLNYLQDTDDSLPGDHLLDGGYSATVIHTAQARWAASTAMTALDLCAASIGILYLASQPGGKFHDVGSLKQNRRDVTTACAGASAWLSGVTQDRDFVLVREARDSLTHRYVGRHFRIGVGGARGTAEPTGHSIPSRRSPVSSDEIVRISREVATKYVVDFVARVRAGAI